MPPGSKIEEVDVVMIVTLTSFDDLFISGGR